MLSNELVTSRFDIDCIPRVCGIRGLKFKATSRFEKLLSTTLILQLLAPVMSTFSKVPEFEKCLEKSWKVLGFVNFYEKSWKSPEILQNICLMNFLFQLVYNEFLPSFYARYSTKFTLFIYLSLELKYNKFCNFRSHLHFYLHSHLHYI